MDLERKAKMTICVKNEIGQLRKVLLHRPGKELEHLVPDDISRLLFDDIPYLKLAQREHDFFSSVLQKNGAQVLYLEKLMAETLRADSSLRKKFISQFIAEGGVVAQKYKNELYTLLMDIEDDLELILKTMAGVGINELKNVMEHSPLATLTRNRDRFALDPIPNLYFQRDPFACIGQGVSLNSMYSCTRKRETIYGEYILKYHPGFAGHVPLYYERTAPFSIEGGDILNLSEDVLVVGISQRTMPESIEILAQNIFNTEDTQIKRILALEIPSIRAYMHLDTVFTQVDYDKFIFHSGILESLRIFEISKGCSNSKPLRVIERGEALDAVLKDCLGIDEITLIPCGGKDRAVSEREQWNDGSNTLCISPGKIVVYDRNYVTNEVLRDHGLEVLEIPSSELSRGRGGPRCMSMPLVRDVL